MAASDLEGSRVTVMFGPFRAREVLPDQWTQPRTWQRPGTWKDFTFLKMKSTSMRPHGAVHQPPTHEESSDGSTHIYELVTAEYICFLIGRPWAVRSCGDGAKFFKFCPWQKRGSVR